MNTSVSTLTITKFDYDYLMDNQLLLQQLSDVYCSVWERDENFGEYRQCPTCERYFSFEEVEQLGTIICSDCNQKLVPAWSPVSVALNLVDMSRHHSFIGVLLMDEEQVVGFSWGRLYEAEELKARLGVAFDILSASNPDALFGFYVEELGVLTDYRGMGFGKKLVKEVLTQPFVRYPSTMGFLSTHENSPSVQLYESLGFIKLANHPAGQGRIRMGIDQIRNFHIFK